MKFFDANETAALLPFGSLVETLRTSVGEYAAGKISCPARLVIPLQASGLMLSMPASAPDIAIQKLVTICPGNRMRSLPTVFGIVLACDTATGEPYFGLDGATVTGRRTAAMTVLATQVLHRSAPTSVVLIGTGDQASHHVRAISECFPDASIHVIGTSAQSAAAFCRSHASIAPKLRAADGNVVDEDADLVVTLTTSKMPVYFEAARKRRLVAGVGAFTPDAAEVAGDVVRSSVVVVDDPDGARHEAGDVIQANVDWSSVRSLADFTNRPRLPESPIFYKSVGCAAWDLAACRVAVQSLGPTKNFEQRPLAVNA